jgi:hypothetical protein
MENKKNTNSETTNEVETPQAETQQAETPQPIATLLSSISYTDQADYEKFLANLTPEHAVLVLVSSANHCQAKGIFNLDEAELIAKAIKTLSKPQPNVEQSK